ncbi:MAG: hypothetical protein MR815_04550 [Oscillospiraceae bacterium]|nr:hypothetical protein [Oscillospiraceae bacterium]
MASVFIDMESPVSGFSPCAVVALSAGVVIFGKVVAKSPMIPPVVDCVPVVPGASVVPPVVAGTVGFVVMGVVVPCVGCSVVGACVGFCVSASLGFTVSLSEGFAVSVSDGFTLSDSEGFTVSDSDGITGSVSVGSVLWLSGPVALVSSFSFTAVKESVSVSPGSKSTVFVLLLPSFKVSVSGSRLSMETASTLKSFVFLTVTVTWISSFAL